jgi:hypothetical protein
VSHDQRIAVGLGLGDFRHGDIARGAGLVLDVNLLSEYLRHFGRDRTPDNLGASARSKRHHEPDRPDGIRLRLRREYERECDEDCGGDSLHG